MKNKKFVLSIFNKNGYYIWLLYLCSVVISLYDIKAAAAVFALATICLSLIIASNSNQKKGIKTFLNALTDNMYDEVPCLLGGNLLPLVIIRHDGIVLWYNDAFSKLVDVPVIKKLHITEAIRTFDLYKCINTPSDEFYTILHNNRNYQIEICASQTDKEKYYALHFKDCTEFEILKTKYTNDRFISAVIVVDNYDEVMMDVTNSEKLRISTEIEETLNMWAQSINAIIKKYEKDRFLMYFSNKGLMQFLENKFEILKKVREIAIGNRLSPTLSIGVGSGGENMLQNETYAYNALDMALGRGGDQAIVKNDEKYLFFGGKTQETEKRTKVKARVVAEAIKQLLNDNDEIMIMGHKHADNDSFGAAIGIFRAVRSMGKSCKIVMDSYNHTVMKMLDNFSDEEYEDVFINKAYANEIISKRTLLFVVDTHVKSLVEAPSLLEISKNIVVIDHHRRNADYISNPLISYHEPYASSACELVTEIVQYMGDKVRLSKKEAEALYSGIYMDTKNFTFKTGVRTFEAASYLKKLGVDTIAVKKLFQIDINTFMKKWQIMESALTYKHCISIAKCEKNDVDMQIIISQAADELLNISDINCSFVLCDMGDCVMISGRSLGSFNIQLIMEKLGGGGHLTIAAAKLNDIDLDTAEKLLKNAIDEYMSENKI